MILKTTTSNLPIFIEDTSKLISHKQTLEAAEFILAFLFQGNEEKIKDIGRVEIFFSVGDIEDKDESGYTDPEKTSDNKTNFKIWVSERKNLRHQLITLFHELVHVRQEMIDEAKLTDKESEDISNLPYEDNPFEQEAFLKEVDLYKMWKKHKAQEKI